MKASAAPARSVRTNAVSLRAATAQTVSSPGALSGLPVGRSTPREFRKEFAPSGRGLPSAHWRYSQSASKGGCRPFLDDAQASGQLSKAVFQASACSRAESRSTPSVWNTTACGALTRIPHGGR